MYFITVIRIGVENKVEDFKTVGYAIEKDEAKRLVRENSDNLFEGGKYSYAIVSFVDEGVFQKPEEIEWFNFKQENKFWISIDECEAPEGLEDYEPYIMG